jgi:hypothetical protein
MRRALRPILLAILPLTLACGGAPEEGESTKGVVEEAADAAVRGIDRAHQERTLGILEGLRLALERQQIDTGSYPVGSSLDGISRELALLLPRVETRDAWRNTMTYSSDGSTYTIISAGEDGAFGTEDDITLHDGAFTVPP